MTAAAADRKFDLLSLGTFVVLGLPDGMLGTAWPAMRSSCFHRGRLAGIAAS